MQRNMLHYLLDRMNFIFSEGWTLFLRAVVPYKNADHYRYYYATCTKVAVEKDQNTLRLFNLYFIMLTYFGLLQLALYLTPTSILGPLSRIVFIDGVFILQISSQFYLFYIGLMAYSAYLSWSLHYRSIQKLDLVAKEAIYESSNECPGMSRSIPDAACFSTPKSKAKYRRLVMIITNAMQIFILFMDLCLLVFMPVLAFSIAKSGLFQSVLTFAILTPVLLLHLLFFFIFWCSFGHIFCFMATYSMIGIVYLHLIFEQNYNQLRKALKNIHKRPRDLEVALQGNLHLFEIFFLGDAFFGQILLVYLALNMPASAYFIMQIAFGQINGLVLFITLGLIGEALLGSLGTHLYAAYLAVFVNKSGKLLMSFVGKHSLYQGSPSLPVKTKLHLWTHINRLVIKKKYGINYGALGTLVSMKSFLKCCLLYGELFMYSFTWVKS